MMLVLARPLILTLYGAKWAASADVLAILSIYGVASMVCLLFANMLTSFGRTKILFVLQLIWIGTLVPAMVLGVRMDGIVGAAYAHIAVIVPIVLPSYLLALKRVTGVRLTALGKAALPPFLASAAAALAARAAASQLHSPLAQLIAGLAAGGVVYVIGAGRQAITVFGRGRAAERVLRLYSAPARLVRLPGGGRAKRSAWSGRERVAEALIDTDPMQGTALAAQGRQLGADRLEGLASHASLLDTYHQGGWLTQAIAVHERALAERKRQLGPDHPHTLASRANLAYAYHQAGWLARAIPLYERTLADRRRLLGPGHPRTLRSANYLASAYRDAGRLAEAIPLYERTLAYRRRLLGSGDPSTLRSSSYLARAYRDAGRLAEAIPLFERTLAGWHRLLGPDDPSTLRSSNYLARAYRDAGRLAEAIPLLERTLARCTRVLGRNHALTRKVRRDLNTAHELQTRRAGRAGPPGQREEVRGQRGAERADSHR
jgi:tetratricopeptide (TPR) repeat protein